MLGYERMWPKIVITALGCAYCISKPLYRVLDVAHSVPGRMDDTDTWTKWGEAVNISLLVEVAFVVLVAAYMISELWPHIKRKFTKPVTVVHLSPAGLERLNTAVPKPELPDPKTIMVSGVPSRRRRSGLLRVIRSVIQRLTHSGERVPVQHHIGKHNDADD